MNVPSLFKAYSQPAKLMQPTQRSFDNPPVHSQATAVGVPRFARTGRMWRRRNCWRSGSESYPRSPWS